MNDLTSLTLGRILERGAAQVPDNIAVVDGTKRITYAGLNSKADALSAGLAAQTGAELEEMWLNNDPEGRSRLEACGFECSEVPGKLMMVARAFDDEVDLPAIASRGYLTMADADLV